MKWFLTSLVVAAILIVAYRESRLTDARGVALGSVLVRDGARASQANIAGGPEREARRAPRKRAVAAAPDETVLAHASGGGNSASGPLESTDGSASVPAAVGGPIRSGVKQQVSMNAFDAGVVSATTLPALTPGDTVGPEPERQRYFGSNLSRLMSTIGLTDEEKETITSILADDLRRCMQAQSQQTDLAGDGGQTALERERQVTTDRLDRYVGKDAAAMILQAALSIPWDKSIVSPFQAECATLGADVNMDLALIVASKLRENHVSINTSPSVPLTEETYSTRTAMDGVALLAIKRYLTDTQYSVLQEVLARRFVRGGSG